MTDKVVSLRGAPVAQADSEPDPLRAAFMAAVERALADGARCGVLVFEGANGGMGFEPVECSDVMLRGLIEEARDWIRNPGVED